MDQTKTSADYLDRAETCRRWASVIVDAHEIAKLRELAAQYADKARSLRSIEQAPLKAIVQPIPAEATHRQLDSSQARAGMDMKAS